MTATRARDGNFPSRRCAAFQCVSRLDRRILSRTGSLVRRDTREKIVVSLDDLAVRAKELLEDHAE